MSKIKFARGATSSISALAKNADTLYFGTTGNKDMYLGSNKLNSDISTASVSGQTLTIIKKDGTSISLTNSTYTVNNGALTLNVGTTTPQTIGNTFTANSGSGVSYTIPFATMNGANSSYGVVAPVTAGTNGNAGGTGWIDVSILNGRVKSYNSDTTYTFTSKDACIGTALTTIATIGGVDIKAAIDNYETVSSFNGHTHGTFKLNGTSQTSTTPGGTASTPSFYAPIVSGSAQQVLISNGGDSAPTWVNQSGINAGYATSAGYVTHNIYFKNTAGTLVSFKGASDVDLSAGVNYATSAASATSATTATKVGHGISFKNASGTTVSFTGAATVDLTGGVYYAKNSSTSDYATTAGTIDGTVSNTGHVIKNLAGGNGGTLTNITSLRRMIEITSSPIDVSTEAQRTKVTYSLSDTRD